ncbi:MULTISPECIES: hypothetical protein [unclassified Pseudoalteromonas]|uniref:hypothetical protein n=1 Tax=unclassified Pseudoalteromonas TaxID=194690 RepID=UPI0025B5CF7E|nr:MULTISPECIES: hypothetical protein [unclassified Pseudoalteromonas]MDN3429377.1 hypothetical protein [Pseudoalteromonas sp. APC 3907]MDN3464386.1 hypothetical protein [Pseudoalteromonas sp. APC 3495]
MFRKSILISTLLLTSFANSAENIPTSSGIFSITEKENDYYEKEQTYKLEGKVVGKSSWLGVEGKLLGNYNNTNYISVSGYTGGSGCLKVISIVKVNKNEVSFSPSLNACGGIKDINFKNGVVTVTALERDEKTQVKYIVKEDSILQDGVVPTTTFSFIAK